MNNLFKNRPASQPFHVIANTAKYRAPTIFISAGEASGDLHASNLVQKVKKLRPDIHFCGMGGKLLRESGVDIIVDSTELAVIGLFETFKLLPRLIKIKHKIKNYLKTAKPQLVILVDYPGFNLHLAKVAKKMGLKVLYYISPKIWAWHKSRINTIRRYVDHMAVIFPFEVAIYKNANVPVTFVRNSLLDSAKPSKLAQEAKKTFGFSQEDRVIGLFVGSRYNEIKRLLPVLTKAAEVLHKQHEEDNSTAQLQFILPLASSLTRAQLEPYLNQSPLPFTIHIVADDIYNVINVCDAIIAVSGTVTLEIALLAKPMVIIYRVAALTYHLAKKVIKIPYIGLCNIVAGKKVVQELIQHEANPESIASEINKILQDAEYRSRMIDDLKLIKAKLEGKEYAQENGEHAISLSEPMQAPDIGELVLKMI